MEHAPVEVLQESEVQLLLSLQPALSLQQLATGVFAQRLPVHVSAVHTVLSLQSAGNLQQLAIAVCVHTLLVHASVVHTSPSSQELPGVHAGPTEIASYAPMSGLPDRLLGAKHLATPPMLAI